MEEVNEQGDRKGKKKGRLAKFGKKETDVGVFYLQALGVCFFWSQYRPCWKQEVHTESMDQKRYFKQKLRDLFFPLFISTRRAIY